MKSSLYGLVAATHTPFDSQGQLHLAAIERQGAHLAAAGVRSVFIGGSTGESHSLTVEERLALARRWRDVWRGPDLRLVVHVGSNCLADARTLAGQAEELAVDAISALSPSYFKPKGVDALVACCTEIARAAPGTPFYFYDIPSLTGVECSMPHFLQRAAERVPTLAGLKFTNSNLMAYQQSLHVLNGRFDIPWGTDECLLAALAMGAKGAVGSTYNFAAAIYQRLIAAFEAGDLDTARMEQYRSVQLVELLASFGYMAAAKGVMTLLGVDVGPPRLPHTALDTHQYAALREGLHKLGFFDWL